MQGNVTMKTEKEKVGLGLKIEEIRRMNLEIRDLISISRIKVNEIFEEKEEKALEEYEDDHGNDFSSLLQIEIYQMRRNLNQLKKLNEHLKQII
jgi:hypothetical protein